MGDKFRQQVGMSVEKVRHNQATIEVEDEVLQAHNPKQVQQILLMTSNEGHKTAGKNNRRLKVLPKEEHRSTSLLNQRGQAVVY